MRETLFCPNCGTEISAEAKFCFNCGAKMEILQNAAQRDDSGEISGKEELVVSEVEPTEQNEQDKQSCENVELAIVEKEKDKLCTRSAEENEQILSEVLPYKKEILFGEEICFESSYFLYDYIIANFRRYMDKHKSDLISTLNEAGKKIHLLTDYDLIIGFGMVIDSMWREAVNSTLNKIPLFGKEKRAVRKKIELFYEKSFNSMSDDLQEVKRIFEDIDADVDAAKVSAEIKKASRGMWVGGGFGLSGAIKGAAMSSLLNAGSGLMYDIKNSVTVGSAKGKASKSKKELFKSVIAELENFVKNLIEDTPATIYWIILREYNLKYSDDIVDHEEALYDSFKNAADIQEKRRRGIELIKINPQGCKYYIHLSDLTDDLKDQNALIEISKWFPRTYEVKNYIMEKVENSLNNYEESDIKKCDRLLEIENAFHYRYAQRGDILMSFLKSSGKAELKEYTIEELQSGAEYIKAFGAKYGFDVTTINAKRVRTYIHHYKELTLKDYSVATVNKMYDIIEKLVEKSGETKETRRAKDELRDALIKQNEINVDTDDVAELKKSIDKLYQLKSRSKCDFSFYIKKAVSKYCKVEDIVYPTLEEADLARSELSIMNSINSDKSLTAAGKFNKILQQDFKTKSVKPIVAEMERKLIKAYEENKRGRDNCGYSTSAGWFIFSLLASVTVLAIGANFSVIGIIIAILILISIWSKYKDKYKDAKRGNEIRRLYVQNIREFENLFIIQNNHIVKK